MRKIEEKKSKERFIDESGNFFYHLSNLEASENQCNRLNCNNSVEICKILPEYFLDKVNMPKPICLQGSKVYLPK